MDQFPADNLPPELDELGKRMSDERPVASDRTLDRVMTRAQAARPARKSGLLWRSSAPRTPRKTLALVCAALLTTGGMAATANAGLLDNLLGGTIGNILGSSGAKVTGNCSSTGLIAVGGNVGGDCSGGKKGTNCSAVGAVSVGLNALGDCSSSSSSSAKGTNCGAVGTIAIAANVLGDCSGANADEDAADAEYTAVDNCSAVGVIAIGLNVLGDCT